jgi:hypothetical protein
MGCPTRRVYVWGVASLFPESYPPTGSMVTNPALPSHKTTNWHTANPSDVLPARFTLIPFGTDERDIGY